MSVIAFSRAIGPVAVSCVLRERLLTELEITEIPIEFGAAVTDHAYPLPKRVRLEIADNGAAATYNALVRFQESRVPFTLVTGLSVFRNMLIKRLEADRDKDTSRILSADVELQEIIIVDTAYAFGAAGEEVPEAGEAGGAKSTRAARPTVSRAGDAATADRVAGPIQRGDSPSATVPADRGSTILSRVFG